MSNLLTCIIIRRLYVCYTLNLHLLELPLSCLNTIVYILISIPRGPALLLHAHLAPL